MTLYDTIIKSYCTALLTNNYAAMMSLFAPNATVISYFAGEKPASEFFQNLFGTSRRTAVELKTVFVGAERENMVAAHLHLEATWNEKFTLQFEAVDIFEFDDAGKIVLLRIILDTYPLRKLQASRTD